MSVFDFTTVSELFTGRKKIVLTSHSNPDGDAVGSSLALYHFFVLLGHDVSVILPNSFPDFLSWLPGNEHILYYDRKTADCDAALSSCDVLFSLDYNAPSRIGPAEKSFSGSHAIKILIDHHIDPEKAVYDHLFSTTQVSSTSELVFRFMAAINKHVINKDIAENIYVGILTDTGSFSYNCNYAETFRIVSELIQFGIDANHINRLVYSTNSESRLRLLGYALSEKLVVNQEFHTAYIALTKKELNRFNHKTGDTEGLVNYALSIRGIRFAALFTERENKIRISFRSVGSFSVNEFARTHFEGGGHKNAAGGDSFVDMDQTIERFVRLLEDYSESLQ